MAGGTQVTTTSTEPWVAQQGYLEEGMRRGKEMLEAWNCRCFYSWNTNGCSGGGCV